MPSPFIAPLVAVHGLKRCGKGTITAHLQDRHGYAVLKFATGLKAMSEVVLRHAGYSQAVIDRCIESDLKEVKLPGLGGITPRRLMQVVGSEFRELFAPDVWTNIFARRQRELRLKGIPVAVDDLRFPKEYSVIQSCALYPDASDIDFWMVERPNIPAERAPLDLDEVMAAVSEPVVYDGVLLDKLLACFAAQCSLSADRNRGLKRDVLDGATINDVGRALTQLEALLFAAPKQNVVHVSEHGLSRDLFAHVFVNDGTIAELHEKAEAVLTFAERPFLAA